MDSSVLVSLYAPDANSGAAAACVRDASGPFPLTPFGEMEVANAIHLRVFRREITAAQASAALASLASDLAGGVFVSVPMPADAYSVARRLSREHTAALGTRALDVLHVASALAMGAKVFYTFDRAQSRLARAAGLAAPIRTR